MVGPESLLLDPHVAAALFMVSLIVLVISVWGVFLPEPRSYRNATVGVSSSESDVTLHTRVADTLYKQFVGLSRTETLDTDEGMLFLHSTEKHRRYAMRNVSLSLDMVFVDSDGVITEIVSMERPSTVVEQLAYETHKAPCQTVIEAPYGWAEENSVEPGDTVSWEIA